MRKLLSLILLLASGLLAGQGVIRVQGNTLFSTISDKVKPGTTILLEKEAALVVRGGLSLKGTESNRIVIRSVNMDAPGRGLVFEASGAIGQKIEIEHVMFKHLDEAIYIEAYSQYKSIHFTNLKVISSGGSGSSLSFYNMLSGGIKGGTEIELNRISFIGNSGNVRFLGVDDEISSFKMKDILFAYNNNFQLDRELLEVEAFTNNQENIFEFDNLVFIQNRDLKYDKDWSISLNGVRDTLSSSKMFMQKSTLEVILDGRRDINRSYLPVDLLPRLPPFALNFSQLPIFTFSNDTLVSDAMNQLESVKELSGSTRSWVKIRDRKAALDSTLNGETLVLSLIDGRTLLVTSPDKKMRVEEDVEELGEEEVSDLRELSDSIADLLGNESVQLILDKVQPMRRQEVGMIIGVSYYIGDANLSGIFPSSIDYAASLFYNYLLDDRWSFGARYQYTRIAMGSASVLLISPPKNRFNFRNDLHSVRFDSHYSLWQRKQGKSVYGYLTGEIGLGLGVVYFDPKMYGRPGGLGTDAGFFSLRQFGTEGQNFLEGESRYGYLAMEIAGSGRLRWALGRISFLLEGALVVTTTDYLDDMSTGNYYGGSREEYIKHDPNYVFYVDPGVQGILEMGRLRRLGKDQKVTRGNNALPDSYVTFQVGVSYTLQN